MDKQTLDKIQELLESGKFQITLHAEKDILKQGYDWSQDFIIGCLKNGKIFTGKELYPEQDYPENLYSDIKERHKRYYCIHQYKEYLIATRLILIGFLILDELLVIHISPINKNSKDGKIYSNL